MCLLVLLFKVSRPFSINSKLIGSKNAVFTHGRSPRLRASLGPSISPPPPLKGYMLLVDPSF